MPLTLRHFAPQGQTCSLSACSLWAQGDRHAEASGLARRRNIGPRRWLVDIERRQQRSRLVPLSQLRHVRWAVRATLTLGVAASVLANILHAEPNPISQSIAAWPPLALLLTVELISRVPVLHRSLALARLAATATIASIAAWVSYWHMAGVAAKYGETGASPYLLPLSVDGLIVVASICLVELAGRIRTVEAEAAQPAAAPMPAPMPAPAPARVSASAPAATKAAPQRKKAAAKPRRPVTETVALAAQIEAKRPDLSEADVAQQLGITTARLRAVRRQARELEQVPELELAA
jgi:hypothetical protein